ncbi:hypothetical protein OIU77_016975 [Salix suchowensis]|uniref:Major facilitator superfamily (MFS) profile domain-containing protein n=1 Tax=Salix suchowensis TaxID=1278906 RepID=A0ABQ8ZMH8_9ROSI|nr:hypothetical protein OIU77_016975 [Salix suchowensis]
MAGGAFADGATLKRAHLYEYKTTSYFIFSCLVAAMGGSLFGYDLGVSGGVTSMDDFLSKFFPDVYRRKQKHLHETDYCKYDNQTLTLFTSSLYFGALVFTFAASHLTRSKGRRASIIFGSLSFFFGAIINAFAMNVAMLIIGRLLLGVGIGFSNQAVPLYLSEMAPAKSRGRYNQLFQLTTCLGILVANLVNYGTEKIHPWGWRLSLGSATIPAVLMGVGALFLPETPNSLVEQGKLEKGRKVLEKVRGTSNVDAEFADLIDASNEAKAIKNPFRNLLTRKNRPQLIIGALGIPMFQQLTGMNSILFYAPVFFQSLGFGSGTSLYSSVITSGALVVGAITSMALVDKFGRRTFFIEASIEMFCYMVALAVTLAREVWTRSNSLESNQRIPSHYHLPVLLCLWKVVGSSRVAGSERALSTGDKVSWPKHCCLCQHDLHSCDSTMLSRVSLPSSLWDFSYICRLGRFHGHLHLLSPSRNKASPNRGDIYSLPEPLVLEENSRRWH